MSPPCHRLGASRVRLRRCGRERCSRRGHPDLAVSDLAGPGRVDDQSDRGVGGVVVDDHLQPDLRNEVHRVPGAAVDLGVAVLASVPPDLADRESVDTSLPQCCLDVVDHERFHDRGESFMSCTPFAVVDSTDERVGRDLVRALAVL